MEAEQMSGSKALQVEDIGQLLRELRAFIAIEAAFHEDRSERVALFQRQHDGMLRQRQGRRSGQIGIAERRGHGVRIERKRSGGGDVRERDEQRDGRNCYGEVGPRSPCPDGEQLLHEPQSALREPRTNVATDRTTACDLDCPATLPPVVHVSLLMAPWRESAAELFANRRGADRLCGSRPVL